MEEPGCFGILKVGEGHVKRLAGNNNFIRFKL
jgi:hypothetical protein